MFLLGLQAAAWRVPFLPTRVGLGSDLLRLNPSCARCGRPTPSPDGPADEELVAVPALHLDAALCHLNVGDERGNAAFLGPDLYFDDLMLEAARPAAGSSPSSGSCRPSSWPRRPATSTRMRISRLMVDGVVEAPNGAHPTSCDPDYGRDEAFQKQYAGSAREPDGWDGVPRRVAVGRRRGDLPAASRRAGRGESADDRPRPGPTSARWPSPSASGATARSLANPIGTIPMIGGRLARASFEPDLMMTDGEAALIANDEAVTGPDGRWSRRATRTGACSTSCGAAGAT